MPYIKRIVVAGDTVEVYKYHSSRYGSKNHARTENKSTTTPEAAKLNEEHAREKLRWLVNTNFTAGDIHMVLTYRREARPPREELRNILRRFKRDLRKLYKSCGKELRYITTTEYEKTAPHHHMIVNYLNPAEIAKIWTYGRVFFTTLDDIGNYANLGDYFIKETAESFKTGTVSGKRWEASKNLKQPTVTREVVSSDSWTETPRVPKGFYLDGDSYIADVNSNGYAFQKYTLIKIKQNNNVKKGERNGAEKTVCAEQPERRC